MNTRGWFGKCKKIIGVDFDNTIVSYDQLIYDLALARNLIPPHLEKSKKSMRDHIRRLPGGEIEWQKIQAQIYGKLIHRAKLIDGVLSFFSRCRDGGHKIYIVSHKTLFANYDNERINLRDAAMSWMVQHGLLNSGSSGLCAGDVYFESTREDKIKRVASLNCTHYIDDLEETFLESSFPPGVEKILFSPNRDTGPVENVRVFSNWRDIADYLL